MTSSDAESLPTQLIFKDLEFSEEQINEAKADIDSMYDSFNNNLSDFKKSILKEDN